MDDVAFNERLKRLQQEEFTPRNLTLSTRELANGVTRYILESSITGAICDVIDLPSTTPSRRTLDPLPAREARDSRELCHARSEAPFSVNPTLSIAF